MRVAGDQLVSVARERAGEKLRVVVDVDVMLAAGFRTRPADEIREVVGEQPLIRRAASLDCVSGCPLNTSHGTMEGSYLMVMDGYRFGAVIPRFELVVPAEVS